MKLSLRGLLLILRFLMILSYWTHEGRKSRFGHLWDCDPGPLLGVLLGVGAGSLSLEDSPEDDLSTTGLLLEGPCSVVTGTLASVSWTSSFSPSLPLARATSSMVARSSSSSSSSISGEAFDQSEFV